MFYMHLHVEGLALVWWLLTSIGMIAFLALLISGIAWLVRERAANELEQPPSEAPAEILKRRLAEGGISLDEYERLYSVLEDERPGPVQTGRSEITATNGASSPPSASDPLRGPRRGP